MRRQIVVLALIAGLAGCNSSANALSGPAQRDADATTKAIYNNDVGAATSSFDDRLKATVTRSQVGALSDKINALGGYKGLTLLSSDSTKSEFTYRADFDRGSVNVSVRVDANGQLAAYRVYSAT